MRVPVKVINRSNNPLPAYKTVGAAAADIAADEDVVLEAGETLPIRTGLYVEVPEGWQISIRSRSGMSTMGVVVTNAPATIDCDYRGEVKVILSNTGRSPVMIHTGDRIAQILLEPVTRIEWIVAGELSATERGEGGLGHTGR